MFRRFTSRSEASPSSAMSEDEDEEPGFPAQLHQEYTPPPERRDASKASYHGAAAVEYVRDYIMYCFLKRDQTDQHPSA